MTLCRWLPCHLVQICDHNGKEVIAILYGILEYTPKFAVFKSLILAERVSYILPFDKAPKEVVWYCKIRWAGRVGVPETADGILNLKTSLLIKWRCHTAYYHAQSCLEQLLTQHKISMQVLKTWFPCRTIAHFADITWPAFLPDLEAPNYIFWGYAESKVYGTHPAITGDLKQQIQGCIQGILKYILHVTVPFQSWLQGCTEQHGGYPQSVIFVQ